MDNKEAAAIAAEFPGWEAWAGLVNGLWHARILGAVPPVMVHAETPDGIREQIRQYRGPAGVSGQRASAGRRSAPDRAQLTL
jgi:hypothetical protein